METAAITSCHPHSPIVVNDISLNTKTFYDFNGVAIARLSLFADEANCYALWAELKDIYNPGGQCFTITDLRIIETDHDQSAQGAIDSIPHAMCSLVSGRAPR